MTHVFEISVFAAAVITFTLAALRYEAHERARIRRYGKRLAYRDARVLEDSAWRIQMAAFRAALDQVRALDLTDLLGAETHAPSDPADVLWAEHDEPLRLVEGGVTV